MSDLDWVRKSNKWESNHAVEEAELWFKSQKENLERSLREMETYESRMKEATSLEQKSQYLDSAVLHLQQQLRVSEAVRFAGNLRAAHATKMVLDELDK